jgi:5-methyltetrahydrofolate--homocysteine methyltransferase
MSQEMTDAILGMREDEALSLVKSMLEDGTDPQSVLDQAKDAMTELGRRFECEEAFIPELIMGGEIMQAVASELKPHLASDKASAAHHGKVVIATVKGDIHDIGKDIVVLMLDAKGYEVIDLGVDVPIDTVVQAVREHVPEVLALSGLLTLAFDSMKETVDAIVAAGLRDHLKIMVGGAPADQQVQEYTGADGWGNDVGVALKLADEWIGGAA